VVFLVRTGNPKNIHEWNDLIKPGVEIITPNPKTSGGARWNYLAAWGAVLKSGQGPEQAREFVSQMYHNVKVLDTGARAATTTFVERGLGDVLIAWENEALLAQHKLGSGAFEVIRPSISILAEPPVAWVDANVEKHGTANIAKAYLDFLYTDSGQELAAKHFFRPRVEAIRERYQDQFPPLQLFTLHEVFGSWQKAHDDHFADRKIFDQIYTAPYSK
jgi:sulfate transport system substrate-binding protein